ncbi:MAG: hypothetical protein PVF56_10295 [Desulfobacterales bacterium]|jgi:hypothetical protein
MKKGLIIFFIFFILACTPNQRFSHLVSAEERMVQDCQYLDTLSGNSDPGRILPKYRENDVEHQLMWRADRLGATHMVWLYNYKRVGSAALVYRCEAQ